MVIESQDGFFRAIVDEVEDGVSGRKRWPPQGRCGAASFLQMGGAPQQGRSYRQKLRHFLVKLQVGGNLNDGAQFRH